jgi:hypothetical protein
MLLPDFPTMKFSPLLVSVILILSLIIGLVAGLTIHYIAGISLGVAWLLIVFAFLVLIRHLLRHKDYAWTANVAQLIKKRLEILRFLLQVLFMNPYMHQRGKTHDTVDCQKMK